MTDYERFVARMAEWEARAKVVPHGITRDIRMTRPWDPTGPIEFAHIVDILKGAKSRCENPNVPNYRHYGGRGIRFSPEWRGVTGARRFLEHIGPRPSREHTLDRIDNERGYEPGNVRWATRSQQNLNRRGYGRRTA